MRDFFVGDRGIDQGRFGSRQLALVLQNERRGRSAELIFLLLGVERLARQFDRGFGGVHAGAVLLHGELRVADLDAHLVFDLLQAHLGLAVFQFGADLNGLRRAVAQRNIQLQPNAFIGRSGVDQLIESSARLVLAGDRNLPGSGPAQPNCCKSGLKFEHRLAGFCEPPMPAPP